MQSTHLSSLGHVLGTRTPAGLVTHDHLVALVDLFAVVPDPRSRHGRRYELSFLLTCLVAALLCHCNSLDAVGQWCREQQPLLRRVFGPRRHLTPTGSLFRWLVPQLSATQLEQILMTWVLATRPTPDSEPVALDGKTLRHAACK